MIDRNPKPGEYWRTKKGPIVEIDSIINFNPPMYATQAGVFNRSDLIERVKVVPDPHPEPRAFWINVYDDGVGFVAPSRAEADAYARSNGIRIACVPFTEGQFDEE